LIFLDEQLAAVADLVVDKKFQAQSDQPAYQLQWSTQGLDSPSPTVDIVLE
jgi:hypothetical protein